ncbi:MAG: TOBE domain-containing protein [Syntrophomonadaceae bacterium]|jgi:molybdopterin-binding protein
MRISDPNKLVGRIIDIKPGPDMTHVTIDVGDQAVISTITSSAAKDLDLHNGDEVFTLFNSTSVSIIKDNKG